MRTLVALGVLLIVQAHRVPAEEIKGRVVGVHDGDSITVLTAEKTEIKVRLVGIDAPELKQPFGNASKASLSEMVFGKDVLLKSSSKDRYGRMLADVFVGPLWVNESQVSHGMAWVYFKYSRDPSLLDAEATAKGGKVGIWQDVGAVPPWEWRSVKKKQRG